MAVDLKNKDSRARLAKALRRSYDLGASERLRRRDLKNIYRDRTQIADLWATDNDKTAYLNLFAQYVRGNEITLAYRAPRWSVNARTMKGKGFDKRLQMFADKYADVLNLKYLVRQWATDSCFGRAIAKIITSIAPKGVNSPVAPRAYRLNPDNFIPDRSAASVNEMTYAADVYFVDLDEAKKHPFFRKAYRDELTEFRSTNGTGPLTESQGDYDLFATPQCRLVDVWLPTLGVIATWCAPNDEFSHISNFEPLQIIPAETGPYAVYDELIVPDSLEELSRLGQLRPLNMLANDMMKKAADQAYASQRNPVAQLGDEQDTYAITSTPDTEPVLLSNPKSLDLWNMPGPDQSIISMANIASTTFSQHAGNLQVALGNSPGANTARQTNALIGQISATQDVSRAKFEEFLADIGKKLCTLAFKSETLQLELAAQIPGTKYWVNAGWAPPKLLPRVGEIDDYCFEVVAYSTAFRGPQERVAQLEQASRLVLSMMQAQAMGAPIDIEQVLQDAGEAYDQVPNLTAWWSGQPPTPQEKSNSVYQTTAGPPQGSNINYQGVDGGGQAATPEDFGYSQGGLASGAA